MRLTRWNPSSSRNFSSWIDEFFNDAVRETVGNETGRMKPSVNVKETDEDFQMEIAAPGMDKDDFNLEIEEGLLKLHAEKKEEHEEKEGEKFLRREFSYSSFERSFALPENVDAEKIEANYNNGVLQLHIPKIEPAKPKRKRIEIG
jgi:HSP20 family protein